MQVRLVFSIGFITDDGFCWFIADTYRAVSKNQIRKIGVILGQTEQETMSDILKCNDFIWCNDSYELPN